MNRIVTDLRVVPERSCFKIKLKLALYRLSQCHALNSQPLTL